MIVVEAFYLSICGKWTQSLLTLKIAIRIERQMQIIRSAHRKYRDIYMHLHKNSPFHSVFACRYSHGSPKEGGLSRQYLTTIEMATNFSYFLLVMMISILT